MLKKLLKGVTLSILLVLISGCATLKPSRIPEFIEELDQHEFSSSERVTIGDILQYVSELENDV